MRSLTAEEPRANRFTSYSDKFWSSYAKHLEGALSTEGKFACYEFHREWYDPPYALKLLVYR